MRLVFNRRRDREIIVAVNPTLTLMLRLLGTERWPLRCSDGLLKVTFVEDGEVTPVMLLVHCLIQGAAAVRRCSEAACRAQEIECLVKPGTTLLDAAWDNDVQLEGEMWCRSPLLSYSCVPSCRGV